MSKKLIIKGTIINEYIFEGGERQFVQSTVLNTNDTGELGLYNYWTESHIRKIDPLSIFEGLKKKQYGFGAPRPSANPSWYELLKFEYLKLRMENEGN
jgi:hypothetical protein